MDLRRNVIKPLAKLEPLLRLSFFRLLDLAVKPIALMPQGLLDFLDRIRQFDQLLSIGQTCCWTSGDSAIGIFDKTNDGMGKEKDTADDIVDVHGAARPPKKWKFLGLFGKRGEVRDSHDRHANTDVNP